MRAQDYQISSDSRALLTRKKWKVKSQPKFPQTFARKCFLLSMQEETQWICTNSTPKSPSKVKIKSRLSLPGSSCSLTCAPKAIISPEPTQVDSRNIFKRISLRFQFSQPGPAVRGLNSPREMEPTISLNALIRPLLSQTKSFHQSTMSMSPRQDQLTIQSHRLTWT